jgi:hypothetical protein
MNIREILLGLVIAIGLSSSITYAAGPFFEDCETALDKPGYQRLKQYYEAHSQEDENPPRMCFRLNRDEFLVTIVDAGRIVQGLWYFDASTGLYDRVDNQYCPGISIEQEFTGARQKRYVLFKCSNLHLGDATTWYSVLHLTPGKKRQSFSLKQLLAAQEDPEEGFCGTRLSDSATSIMNYQILNESTAGVRIEFAIEEENCKTHKRRIYIRAFQLRDGEFAEVTASSK